MDADRQKYVESFDNMLREATETSPPHTHSWCAMVKLSCALHGLTLVPYNTFELADRMPYWNSIRLRDEDFWVIERNHFNKAP